MNKHLIIVLITTLFLSSCGGANEPPTPRVEDIQTAIAQTEAAKPTATFTPIPPTETPTPAATSTLAPSPTPTTSGPLAATVDIAYLNMRSGPSTMFDVLETVEQGAQFQAIARNETGDWVLVEKDDGTSGWFTSIYLLFNGNPADLPVRIFPNEQIIRGKVHDDKGNPIPGIVVAVIYRDDITELRNDTISDENGNFSSVIPEELIGFLDIQVVGINCESPVMNSDCELSGYFELQTRTFIQIPQTEAINFVFEVATSEIIGVVGQEDEIVDLNTRVVAIRDDGAESYSGVDVNGNFILPASPGIWEVYSVLFQPSRRESDPITVEITDTPPEPISLEKP